MLIILLTYIPNMNAYSIVVILIVLSLTLLTIIYFMVIDGNDSKLERIIGVQSFIRSKDSLVHEEQPSKWYSKKCEQN